jgi:hypothetical protein
MTSDDASAPATAPAPAPAPANASATAPSAPETAAAVAQLADTLGRASTILFNYRNDNPTAAGLDRILNLEMALDRQAIALRKQAIRLLGDEAAQAVSGLHSATQQADAFLAKVQKIEASLNLANAVLALAGATIVGDAGGIVSAVGGVATALKGVTNPGAATA